MARTESGTRPRERKVIRTFTATPQELSMLEALARYHGFSKSSTITSLLKKEFWRVFPGGTDEVRPDPGARIRAGEPLPAGKEGGAP